MNYDCKCQVSCSRCRHKCKDYLDYIEDKQAEKLMQGEDRQPLVRHKGAFRRK